MSCAVSDPMFGSEAGHSVSGADEILTFLLLVYDFLARTNGVSLFLMAEVWDFFHDCNDETTR